MIGHEAVRSNFKAAFTRSSQKLREHEVDHVGSDEYTSALIGAERQEIVPLSCVRQVGMMRRVGIRHVADRAGGF